METYRYKAEGTLEGREFLKEGELEAEDVYDAAEKADKLVRDQNPGVILKGEDEGRTVYPKIYLKRAQLLEAVKRHDARQVQINTSPLPCPHTRGYWIEQGVSFRCYGCGYQHRLLDLPHRPRQIEVWRDQTQPQSQSE